MLTGVSSDIELLATASGSTQISLVLGSSLIG